MAQWLRLRSVRFTIGIPLNQHLLNLVKKVQAHWPRELANQTSGESLDHVHKFLLYTEIDVLYIKIDLILANKECI